MEGDVFFSVMRCVFGREFVIWNRQQKGTFISFVHHAFCGWVGGRLGVDFHFHFNATTVVTLSKIANIMKELYVYFAIRDEFEKDSLNPTAELLPLAIANLLARGVWRRTARIWTDNFLRIILGWDSSTRAEFICANLNLWPSRKQPKSHLQYLVWLLNM